MNATALKANALEMIRTGGEEWVAAAVHVGMADDVTEAWELYEDDMTGDATDTLADLVVTNWRTHGQVVRHVNGKRTFHFADAAE